MAKQNFKVGTTSKAARIFIQDSTSTTGVGLTGLVYNSANLVAYYIKEGEASATAITLVTATLGTWSSGGFKEVDSTNMPGLYEIGIPNASLSTGTATVLMLRGATNMVPCILEMQLEAVNNQDAAGYGLSRIDANITSRSTFAGGAVSSVTNDVGITQAAADKVWGSAARTLTGFGTLIADIWSYITRTLTGDVTIDDTAILAAINNIPDAIDSNDVGTASTPVYAANSGGFAKSRLILDQVDSPPVVVFPAPGNPSLCVISGYVINGSGGPVAGVTLKASLPVDGLVGSSGNILKNREFSFNTDSNGRWLFELLRSDEMLPQSAWHFACCDCGLDVDVTLTSVSYDLGTLVR